MERKLIFTAPPSHVPCRQTPDGAYTGNGDLGIVWGGTGDRIQLYISKVDFWNAKEGNGNGGIRSLGYLEFYMPQLKNASIKITQDMETAMLEGTAANKNACATLRVRVCAEKNILLIDLIQRGNLTSPDVNIRFPEDESVDGNYGVDSCDFGEQDDMKWACREFSWKDFRFSSRAIMVLRRISVNAAETGIHSRYVLRVATNHDMFDYDTVALNETAAVTVDSFKEMRRSHLEWWKKFWSKSSVTLYDKEVELNWYAGQYAMACCSRNKKFPPGLYGNLVTTDSPGWGGDYHLNYNYEAPFYALAASNHVELMEGYETPLYEFMDNAENNAREFCQCRGVYYDVGIGPKGMNTSFEAGTYEGGHLFLGQKSNALYACVVPIMRWYSTYDKDYALETAYPLLRKTVTFWEDYLVFHEGRYVIYNDAIHEVPFYDKNFDPHGKSSHMDDMNPIVSIALLKSALRCIIDMSKELEIDSDRREKWNHMLNNMSSYPTQKKRRKTVFRYTEKGQSWSDGNTLGIQPVYPAGDKSITFSEKTLEIARNTFNVMNRWDDANGFSSYYPCAARLGVEPEKILKNLHAIYKKRQYPNLLFSYGGGCLENATATSNTVNEMLMQSYTGVISLFPCWDINANASFKNLRAYGAFLVSASVSDGSVKDVKIISEKGRLLRIKNPYYKTVVYVNGELRAVSRDTIISIETNCSDVIELRAAV